MPLLKHYDRLFTKTQLEEEYKVKSVCSIAQKYHIPLTCMYRIFDIFKINRRKCNSPGKLSSKHSDLLSSRYIRKYCKICGKKLSINPNAKHCIKCHNDLNSKNKHRLNVISEKMRDGWKNKNFAKKLHTKKLLYKNIYMRSSWEVAYAKYLDAKGIKWLYESKTFDLGNTTYTPDFYLPEFNLYIEIKGYMRKVALNKIMKFKDNYELLVLNKKSLIYMGVLNG